MSGTDLNASLILTHLISIQPYEMHAPYQPHTMNGKTEAQRSSVTP